MAKTDHPGRTPRIYPPSADPNGPRRRPKRRRYGRLNGWPLDVLVWRTPPPEGESAVQLAPDLWIRLELAPEDSPEAPAMPQDMFVCLRVDAPDAARTV